VTSVDPSARPQCVRITELPVQLHGSSLARTVLRLAGWRIAFHGLPARQGVAIVYPHTSNWDFVVGMLAKWGIGITITFWGKDSLFKVPLFGHWLRWIGGVPVDRKSAHGIVGQMARELITARAQDRFAWLALAPEGTRKATDGWRSGFYHVALEARVPLALVYFDYGERLVSVEDFIMLSGDVNADMAEIERYLGHRRGYRPELAAPIRLLS
jgi:1-acyl-sn-glycerol-3-phosphate acyltransferase